MPDDPIIISGGSVQITFNSNVFRPEGGNFRNANVKITSVDIKDDNTGQTQTYDAPDNGRLTITIHCES